MIIVELTLWREGFQRAPDNLPALRLLLEGLQQKEMISTTKVTSEVMPLKRGEKDNVWNKACSGLEDIDMEKTLSPIGWFCWDDEDDDYADGDNENTQEPPGGVVWVERNLHPLIFGHVCKNTP